MVESAVLTLRQQVLVEVDSSLVVRVRVALVCYDLQHLFVFVHSVRYIYIKYFGDILANQVL